MATTRRRPSRPSMRPERSEVLRLHVRNRLAAHAYPREIDFVEQLPKTPSGKLQRFILRNQEIAKQQTVES